MKSTLPTPEVPVEPSVSVTVTQSQVRSLGKNVLSKAGDASANQFGSPQAAAFLTVHGPMLQDRLERTIREFVTEKLVGTR